MIKIRRARRRDAEQIADLAMVLGHWIMGEATRTTAGDVQRYAFGRDRWCDILVAHEGGRILGYALYRVFFEGFTGHRRMFLSDLAIDPESRRDGIGHKLMAAVARDALRLDCDAMTWECGDDNRVALNFYDKIEAARVPVIVNLRIERGDIERLASEKA